jgi:hypothetical protein
MIEKMNGALGLVLAGLRNVRGVLGVSALAMMAVGCSGESMVEGEEPAGEAEQALGFWGQDGYFQESGTPRVFKVYGSKFCWVYDPGELGALQHASRGQWDGYTRPTFHMIAYEYGKTFTGSCGYPNGMYRRDGDAAVYSVASTYYCHVQNNAQVNARGGWGAVLVLKVPSYDMDLSETNAMGPNQMPLGRPRLAYRGDCTN